jgi:arsenite/tail-anchored protein-transporting ATPase
VSAADALVRQLPGTILVLGKGGVGKTTCASALALASAERFQETLVLSTDPARALGTVLEVDVGANPTPVPYAKGLSAQMLDATALRGRFMERWGDVIRVILDRGTYLDDSDMGPLVDTALPGSDEIFAALELANLLVAGRRFDRVVVDTAPTGHTLRLLALPRTFRALVKLLDAMQAKHRFMVKTLTRTYRADDADAFLAEMTRLVSALEKALTDPARTAAVMVTNSEPLVLEETRRYLASLAELRVPLAAVLWNATDAADVALGEVPQYHTPRLTSSPVGEKGLAAWIRALERRDYERRDKGRDKGHDKRRDLLRDERDKPARAPQSNTPSITPSITPLITPLIRPLTVVAGKGGVGKTTVACAIALAAAAERTTLLVSTDPAPSVGDALGLTIPDSDTPVPGADRLQARQMDATAAFARLRTEYQDRVDALFEGLMGRGMDLAHDRAVARDLLALAPPGVDEVYALTLMADALFRNRFECVVVDPAPTGHLLRLLEMPKLALEWSHQLMRLMLKYKEVSGLGETAQEILEFARSLRALDALLHDPAQAGVVLVTLDEPVVRAETERLADEVAKRGVALVALVTNRARNNPALPVPHAPLHFEAPAAHPPPVGVDTIRQWAQSWTSHGSKKSRNRQAQDAKKGRAGKRA